MKKVPLIIGLLIGIFFFWCDGGKDSSPKEPSPDLGDEVYINGNCFGAISESAFNQFMKYVAADDKDGVRELYSRDLIVAADSGQKGKLIDLHLGGIREVRMYDTKRVLWLNMESISKSK